MRGRDAPFRVGFFSNHADIIGGGEISFIDLVDSIRRHGVTPVAFVPGKGEVYDRLCERNAHPCIYSLPPIRISTLPRLLYAFIIMIGILIRNKLHIAHANGARCMLLVGAACRVCRIPVVWHVRVMERDRFLDRIRSMLATAIIANSNAVAQAIDPFCNDSKKIYVVHNGIDINRIHSATPASLRGEFNSPPMLPVVLAAGRLCVYKRFHILIEACALLRESGPAFTCLIIGQDAEAEPQYANTLRAMPGKLGLNNVIFGAWRADVPSIMKSATLFVLPSFNEAFGRVILEAWACGLPLIATNTGGPAEIIEHEKTGILIPPDDAQALSRSITLVLIDKNLRESIALGGFVRVKDFSIEAHAKNIAAIYSRLPRRGRV
jgi:glycosyltransferase involved in cell wall biosynthesis